MVTCKRGCLRLQSFLRSRFGLFIALVLFLIGAAIYEGVSVPMSAPPVALKPVVAHAVAKPHQPRAVVKPVPLATPKPTSPPPPTPRPTIPPSPTPRPTMPPSPTPPPTPPPSPTPPPTPPPSPTPPPTPPPSPTVRPTPPPPPEAVAKKIPRSKVATLFSERECKGEKYVLEGDSLLNLQENKFPNGIGLTTSLSVKVEGRYELDLFESPGAKTQYWASVFEMDGCTAIYDWPPTRGVTFSKTQSLHTECESHKPKKGDYKYRVVYSGESSKYMAYQAASNYYGYLDSKQQGGGWTRLMTSSIGDDMMDKFPTYYVKRHPYSRRYGPLNKGDVIAKWYKSADAPTEDVIVIADPDNWLIKDISKWAARVSPGKALAHHAPFGGALVTTLWKEVCLINCDVKLQMAGIPYVLHRDDLAVIAPLWRQYTLIIKARCELDKKFCRKYAGLQVDWMAEMYGYVFAAAHAKVHHEVIHDLQIRDVESRRGDLQYPFIHMGRIWWPKSHGCKNFCHTEGRGLGGTRGQQVWCKCNITASDIIPWPPPEDSSTVDFVSYHTLRLLKAGREKYGDIPEDLRYRPHDYHSAHA